MLGARLFHRLLGLERTVIEAVQIGEDEAGEYLVVSVRPRKGPPASAGAARPARRGTTEAVVPAGGGGWTWADTGVAARRRAAGNCAEHGPTETM